MIAHHRSGTAAAALLLSGLMLAAPAAGQTVGTVGAVNPVSHGTPPGQAQRVVELGSQVIYRERIVTGETGSLQLAFLDKSTLSIGPNSDIVIDEYVYDPNAGQGRMALTLTRGALRYIGGRISHGGGAEVKTPVATIGIRGAAGTVSHDAADRPGTQVVSDYGRFLVRTPRGSVEIQRPGFMVTVDAGGVPGVPVRVAQAQIDAATRRLGSASGQTGGASNMPTDEIAGSLVGAETAAIAPSDVRPLAGSLSDTSGPSTTISTAALAAQGTGGLMQDAVAQRAAEQTKDTTSPPVDRTFAAGAYAFTIAPGGVTGVNDSEIFPYVSGQISGAPRQAVLTPFMGYRLGGEGEEGSRIRGLQVGFRLDGEGASQSSSIVGAAGDLILGADGRYSYSGDFAASTRRTATSAPAFANGHFTGVAGSFHGGADNVPDSFRYQSTSATQFGGGAVRSTDYSFIQSATRTDVPADVGADRTGQTLQGYAAGIMRTSNYASNALGAPAVSGESYSVLGTTTVTVDPKTQRMSADVVVASTDGGSAFRGGVFQFGNGDTTQPANGVSLDRTTYLGLGRAARDSATGEMRASSAFVVNDEAGTYDSTNQLFVNWKTVTATTPALQQGFAGVAFCQCSYTDWGAWSTTSYRGTGAGTHSEERAHLPLWVAGVPTTVMPTTGIATYTGQAVANVEAMSGSTVTSYIAAGQFSNRVDFAAGSGAIGMELDGRRYAGRTVLSGSQFVGNLSSGSGVEGALVGSFYGPRAAEMGGMFDLGGKGYKATGILVGKTDGAAAATALAGRP